MQRLFGNSGRAADAFGDVLAGEFEVDAAEGRAGAGVSVEGFFEFLDDGVESTGFGAVGGGGAVAVHRVADPEDALVGRANGVDERRESGRLSRAHSGDEHDFAGFSGWVEALHQRRDIGGIGAVAELDADGVLDAAEVLDVRSGQRARALADPRHVGGEVVIPVAARDLASL